MVLYIPLYVITMAQWLMIMDGLQVLIDRDSMVMKNLEVGHLVFSRCGKVMKFLLIIDNLVPS